MATLATRSEQLGYHLSLSEAAGGSNMFLNDFFISEIKIFCEFLIILPVFESLPLRCVCLCPLAAQLLMLNEALLPIFHLYTSNTC